MIDREAFMRMLEESARLMLEEADRLSDIDSRFGDGDHGVTVAKIAKAMQEAVADDDGSRTLKDFLDDLGMTVMAVRGGSAGPLYGTMIGGLGVGLGEEETDLSTDAARRMFESCLAEMRDITSAQVGDKTMMDALIPASRAIAAYAGSDEDGLFAAAAKAAAEGAENSKNFVSKFGRAKSYGTQTIGTPDAGAMSMSYFFQGLAQA